MAAIFPNDAGYADYSSSGADRFIPEIWSGKLQVKFYKTTVLGEITNNDFEGEIKNQGDKVIIRTIPNITVQPYKRGMNLGAAQVPESAPVELLIDRGNFFQVVLDDVNEVQSDLKLMDLFTNDASEQMKIATDVEVLSEVPALADPAN